MNWDSTDPRIENKVDTMLAVLKDAGGGEYVEVMVDRVYRQYIRWLCCAKTNQIDPVAARSTVISLMNAIVLETMVQMSSRDDEGRRIDPKMWVEEFIQDLVIDIDDNLDRIEQGAGHN